MAAIISRSRAIGRLCRPRRSYPNLGCCYMSTVPPAPPSPSLMLPPTFKGRGDNMVYNFYSLSDSKVVRFNGGTTKGEGEEEVILDDKTTKVVGCSHGWVALYNKRNCNLFLTDPHSGRCIMLPSIDSLPIPVDSLRNGYNCIIKVITSTSPDDEEDPCHVMLSYGRNYRLAVCRLGVDTCWTLLGTRSYEDFVYSDSDQLFLCVFMWESQWWGTLHAFDVRGNHPKFISGYTAKVYFGSRESREESFWRSACHQQNYVVVAAGGEILLVRRHIFSTTNLWGTGLVRSDNYGGIFRSDGSFDEHKLEDEIQRAREEEGQRMVKGEMYIVDPEEDRRCTYKTMGFDVYKYDRRSTMWELKESSLDGLSLFIGLNHSTALYGHQLKHKPNSIYYTDTQEQVPNFGYGGHDIGIFNYEDATFSSCYYPTDMEFFKLVMPSPVWFIKR